LAVSVSKYVAAAPESIVKYSGSGEISIRTMTPPSAPEWLQASWKSAKEQGLDQLSMEEIDAEIAAARKARRERRPSEQ
jgi:hypothetical protein